MGQAVSVCPLIGSETSVHTVVIGSATIFQRTMWPQPRQTNLSLKLYIGSSREGAWLAFDVDGITTAKINWTLQSWGTQKGLLPRDGKQLSKCTQLQVYQGYAGKILRIRDY